MLSHISEMSSECFDVSKVFFSEKGPELGLSTEEHEVRNQIGQLSMSVTRSHSVVLVQ